MAMGDCGKDVLGGDGTWLFLLDFFELNRRKIFKLSMVEGRSLTKGDELEPKGKESREWESTSVILSVCLLSRKVGSLW